MEGSEKNAGSSNAVGERLAAAAGDAAAAGAVVTGDAGEAGEPGVAAVGAGDACVWGEAAISSRSRTDFGIYAAPHRTGRCVARPVNAWGDM